MLHNSYNFALLPCPLEQTTTPYLVGYQLLLEKLFLFFETHSQHKFPHGGPLTQSSLQDHIPFIVMLFVNPPHPSCRGPLLRPHHHSYNYMLSLCFTRLTLVLVIIYSSIEDVLCLALSCCLVFYNFNRGVNYLQKFWD